MKNPTGIATVLAAAIFTACADAPPARNGAAPDEPAGAVNVTIPAVIAPVVVSERGSAVTLPTSIATGPLAKEGTFIEIRKDSVYLNDDTAPIVAPPPSGWGAAPLRGPGTIGDRLAQSIRPGKPPAIAFIDATVPYAVVAVVAETHRRAGYTAIELAVRSPPGARSAIPLALELPTASERYVTIAVRSSLASVWVNEIQPPPPPPPAPPPAPPPKPGPKKAQPQSPSQEIATLDIGMLTALNAAPRRICSAAGPDFDVKHLRACVASMVRDAGDSRIIVLQGDPAAPLQLLVNVLDAIGPQPDGAKALADRLVLGDASTAVPSVDPGPPTTAGAAKTVEGPKGNVAVGGASVSGGTIGNAGAVVASMAAGFRRCYQRGLMNDPNMKGSVRVTASVGPKGEVLTAVASGGGGLAKTVTDCVVGVVSSRTFDPPDTGAATLVIPISFFPQS